MKRKNVGLAVSGFFLFLLTSAVSVTAALLVYGKVEKESAGLQTVVIVMFFVVIFLALLFTFADIIRRRITVDKPTEQILAATERIAAGDFSVRLPIEHYYDHYDQYDAIKENLNLMAAELQKSEILKTDFVSNVSHEIKTPLSVIRNYAAQLQKDTLDPETRKKYADIVVKASKRLSNLVTDILKLNKLEHEKILPQQELFRLDESLAEIFLTFEDLIEKKGLEVETCLEEVSIRSVKSYLEIVWSNLISNAIKFTNEGGRVALTLKKTGETVTVSVADTGCGISSETGKRIFDKFYQGDTSHAEEGNGLGLALVKKVIDILGGEILVESEAGQGTTFTVVLKETVILDDGSV